MSDLKSMAWKEWHEVRAFLWIGLGVFLGLPVIGGLEALHRYTHRLEINALPWVLIFGGVLAVFVAVGATTRDFSGHLPDFWQSRPINVVRWLLVKYAVGLLVVLVACMLPICVELLFSGHTDAPVYLAWLPFMWMAMYTLAFLVGVLVRRMAHAAMLGLAAMLLVYFLPLVIPPLEWMNVARMEAWYEIFGREQFEFAAGMLLLTAIGLGFMLAAVRRDWHIESGLKMMYGSVSAALLILFSSAAFQLGTNLPILMHADLPSDESVLKLRCENGHGSILTERTIWRGRVGSIGGYFTRTLKLTDSAIELGPPVQFDEQSLYVWDEPSPENDPDVHYFISTFNSGDKNTMSLGGEVVMRGDETISLGIEVPGKRYDPGVLRLWQQKRNTGWNARVWTKRDKLYVMGSHLITLDISEPFHPKIISDVSFLYPPAPNMNALDRFPMVLPAIPGLSPRERLETVIGSNASFKDDVLCGFDYESFDFYGQSLYAYRLTSITDTKATFEKISQNEPTMLQIVFGAYQVSSMNLQNGLLYETQHSRTGWFNPHVSVLEVGSGRTMRLVGHFAAPEARVALPLPDGRCLVAGSKVWLVGAPPRRNEP